MKDTIDKLSTHMEEILVETGATVVFMLIGGNPLLGSACYTCATPDFRELAAALRRAADQIERAEPGDQYQEIGN